LIHSGSSLTETGRDMRKIAATIALLGAMLLTGGLAYGMSTVSVAPGPAAEAR